MKGELQQQIDFSLRILFPIFSFLNLISHKPNNADGALRTSCLAIYRRGKGLDSKLWVREPGSSVMRCTLIFYSVHDILTCKINIQSEVWVRAWILCVLVQCDLLAVCIRF